MPATATGWICLVALMVSTYSGSALAARHILRAYSRAPFHHREILVMLAFLACMYVAGGLYILVESKP